MNVAVNLLHNCEGGYKVANTTRIILLLGVEILAKTIYPVKVNTRIVANAHKIRLIRKRLL